jgi:hypothetical protein
MKFGTKSSSLLIEEVRNREQAWQAVTMMMNETAHRFRDTTATVVVPPVVLVLVEYSKGNSRVRVTWPFSDLKIAVGSRIECGMGLKFFKTCQ